MKKLLFINIIILSLSIGYSHAIKIGASKTYEDVQSNLKFHKAIKPLEQITKIALKGIRESNIDLYKNIKASGRLDKLESQINDIKNYNSNKFSFRVYNPPVDKEIIDASFNYVLNCYIELVTLVKNVGHVIKSKDMWDKLLLLIDSYFNNLINRFVVTTFKIKKDTSLVPSVESGGIFNIVANVLKQNQNEETKLYISQLFSNDNDIVKSTVRKSRREIIATEERIKRECEREKERKREKERERERAREIRKEVKRGIEKEREKERDRKKKKSRKMDRRKNRNKEEDPFDEMLFDVEAYEDMNNPKPHEMFNNLCHSYHR